MKLLKAFVLTLAVLAIGISAQPVAAQADEGKIVFVSDRDGNSEIYVMNSDGSSQTRLTNNVFRDVDPRWSPDGQHIAFASDRDGTGIFVMNSDGTNVNRLTHNKTLDELLMGDWDSDPRYLWDSAPSWSPDGQRIVFISEVSVDRFFDLEVFVMNADGSDVKQLTEDDESFKLAQVGRQMEDVSDSPIQCLRIRVGYT